MDNTRRRNVTTYKVGKWSHAKISPTRQPQNSRWGKKDEEAHNHQNRGFCCKQNKSLSVCLSVCLSLALSPSLSPYSSTPSPPPPLPQICILVSAETHSKRKAVARWVQHQQDSPKSASSIIFRRIAKNA